MIAIERHRTAERINAVLNDPYVRPWVADESEGPLDIERQVSNEKNILLMGEHGGCMFFNLLPGIYEVHTQVARAGRGAWTRQLTEACALWMFTRSDAYEIMTRIPEGHIGARAAALAQGMRHEFTRDNECQFRGKLGDVHIHSFRVQDWLPTAPDLADIGAWFHDRLHAEARRLGIADQPHGDDDNHNRYVGAAYEMAVNGQIGKALTIYNRWALASRHPTIAVVSAEPLVVKFDIGYLHFERGDIRVTLQ